MKLCVVLTADVVQMSAMLDQLEAGITREVHAAVRGALGVLEGPTSQLLALSGTPSAASPSAAIPSHLPRPPTAASPTALKAHIAALATGCEAVASHILLACEWLSETAHSQQRTGWELEQAMEQLQEEVKHTLLTCDKTAPVSVMLTVSVTL